MQTSRLKTVYSDEITAADAVASMRLSYPALKLVILTGICDGVPFAGQAELLLGDVIISNAIQNAVCIFNSG
ncbi:hypothetical protein V8C34DRAFT_273962 [Trichoderma compactum]